jgi:hypothetical protein
VLSLKIDLAIWRLGDTCVPAQKPQVNDPPELSESSRLRERELRTNVSYRRYRST